MAPTTTTGQLATGLTVQPVDHENWPDAPATLIERHYITITLDLITGTLAIHGDPLYRGHPTGRYGVQPDPENTWVHWYSFPTPVPMHMTWLVSRYLTAIEAENVLHAVAVRARVLLSTLTPVLERHAGGYDWTRTAAAAVDSISAIAMNPYHAAHCEIAREWPSPGDVFEGLATLEDALKAAPELAPTGVAVMADAELDATAERLTRHSAPYTLPNREALQRAANIDLSLSWTHNSPVYLVGCLAGLYRMRAEQSGGLAPVDARKWAESGGAVGHTQVTDNTPDERLAELAAAEERAAADEGLLLLGAADYLAEVRAAAREKTRKALALLGEHTKDLEYRYEMARASRAAMLLRVDAWNSPEDGDEMNRNATLGALAHMSRQAVASLREKHRKTIDTDA